MSAVDDMLEGFTCQVCGAYMDDFESPGYPRTCDDCKEEEQHG